jgi:protein-tyrosine phosphatase
MTDTLIPFAPAERWVPLDGAMNFRDLGGYLTASGATIRWRRLFRSDALDELSSNDRRRLIDDLGLRTVLDLRCDIERMPSAAWAAARHELPILELPSIEPVFPDGVPLHDVYLDMLHKRATPIRDVITTIVESEHPLVFHCSAGKDRTGLIAAVVLGALGVSDHDIARDYALTGRVLPSLLAMLRAGAERAGRRHGAFPAVARTADLETMQAVLRAMRETHGSMLGYALDIGVEPEAIAVLRDRLLD